MICNLIPRKSLLRAVWEIFDDLLWKFHENNISGSKAYHPDFTLTVAKYSDNGGACLSEAHGLFRLLSS